MPVKALIPLLAILLFLSSLVAKPEPASAGAFEFPDQGARASGLANAFVARADDPTAIYYNPGAVALLEEKPILTVGVALNSLNASNYQGLSPGVGAGTTGSQESRITPMIHAYFVKSINDWLKVGAGLTSPFWWSTQWASKNEFSGRFINLDFTLSTYDLAPTVAFKPTKDLGIGISAVVRISKMDYLRREQTVDPFSGSIVDYGSRAVTTGTANGFGLNAGLKYRIGERVSLGFTFRSPIQIDYTGTSTLAQIPTGNQSLDDLLAATRPFDAPLGLNTSVEFPGQAAIGVAVSLPGGFMVEADFVQTGWSTLEALVFDFPNTPEFDEVIVQDFSDTSSLRIGATYRTKSGTEFRAGYTFDESPQPSFAVSPLLPDADRNTFAFGFGKDWLDVAFVWNDLGTRRVDDNLQDFNGNYSTNSWVLSLSISQ